jgi:hypothetical protein
MHISWPPTSRTITNLQSRISNLKSNSQFDFKDQPGFTSVKTFVSARSRNTRANGVFPVGDKDSFNALSLPAPETITQTSKAAAIAAYPNVILLGGGFTAVTAL